MRRVNLDTLEVEEVERIPKDKKTYVYVLCDESSWDYERSTHIDVFKDFNTALENYKARVKESKHDIREWLNEEEIVEDEVIKSEQEYASFDTYEKEDYDRINNSISVYKKEVM